MLDRAEKQMAELQKKFDLKETELAALKKEVSKVVKTSNYQQNYPAPASLEKQRRKTPKACYIQILGARCG